MHEVKVEVKDVEGIIVTSVKAKDSIENNVTDKSDEVELKN